MVRNTMTRPQASTAFLPITARVGVNRPSSGSPFHPALVENTGKRWYSIVAKKNKDGGTTKAEIRIDDEIGGWGITAKDFVKELTALDVEEISLHINSPGGDVFDGVAIYNALRMHSAKVTVFVDSLAASAASFIAQAGDEVIMLRNAEMMIHDASALAWGNEAELLKTAGILDRISNNIADIYSQRAGESVETWRAIMREEMWYSADEAVTAGLADSVLQMGNDSADEARDDWDLQVFNYAGRKSAPSPLEMMREITNRAQEAPVGKIAVKNDTEGTAVASPDAEVTPVTPEVPVVEAPVVVEPVVVVPAEGDAEVEPEVAASNALPGGLFVVNGARTSDPVAVQAHIASLENFRNETRDANRTGFIEALASGATPRILASQIPALQALVATMSDEQYEMWSASWTAAPSLGLLAPQDGGNTHADQAVVAATEDEKNILIDTIKNHKRGGMTPENIKKTTSYNKLIALDPTFTL